MGITTGRKCQRPDPDAVMLICRNCEQPCEATRVGWRHAKPRCLAPMAYGGVCWRGIGHGYEHRSRYALENAAWPRHLRVERETVVERPVIALTDGRRVYGPPVTVRRVAGGVEPPFRAILPPPAPKVAPVKPRKMPRLVRHPKDFLLGPCPCVDCGVLLWWARSERRRSETFAGRIAWREPTGRRHRCAPAVAA